MDMEMVISLADSLVTKRNLSELFRFLCWVLLLDLFGNNSWWMTSPFSRRKKVPNQTNHAPSQIGSHTPQGVWVKITKH